MTVLKDVKRTSPSGKILLQVQCPLDIETLEIAAALPIATSTPVTNLHQYINSDLGYNDLKIQPLCSKIAPVNPFEVAIFNGLCLSTLLTEVSRYSLHPMGTIFYTDVIYVTCALVYFVYIIP